MPHLNGSEQKPAGPSGGDSDDENELLFDDDPRYRGGLSGRAGKPADVCYAWWCGAARQILLKASAQGVAVSERHVSPLPEPWTDQLALTAFLLRCQFHAGGCGKDWEAFPDPLHSCYGVVGKLVFDAGRWRAFMRFWISHVPFSVGLHSICNVDVASIASHSSDGLPPCAGSSKNSGAPRSSSMISPSLGITLRALEAFVCSDYRTTM